MGKVTNLSNASASVEANAFARLMDDGFIDLYDGVQPESADEPVTKQRVGLSLRFSAPAFLPAVNGVIVANPIKSRVATVDLNPVTWARIFRADHRTVVMDVSVGLRDAVIILPSVNIPTGITVTCSFFEHVVTKSSF